MDRISDSDSEDAGSIPAGATKQEWSNIFASSFLNSRQILKKRNSGSSGLFDTCHFWMIGFSGKIEPIVH
jgi:hypothetical protein